jgi:hypothetical protein
VIHFILEPPCTTAGIWCYDDLKQIQQTVSFHAFHADIFKGHERPKKDSFKKLLEEYANYKRGIEINISYPQDIKNQH